MHSDHRGRDDVELDPRFEFDVAPCSPFTCKNQPVIQEDEECRRKRITQIESFFSVFHELHEPPELRGTHIRRSARLGAAAASGLGKATRVLRPLHDSEPQDLLQQQQQQQQLSGSDFSRDDEAGSSSNNNSNSIVTRLFMNSSSSDDIMPLQVTRVTRLTDTSCSVDSCDDDRHSRKSTMLLAAAEYGMKKPSRGSSCNSSNHSTVLCDKNNNNNNNSRGSQEIIFEDSMDVDDEEKENHSNSKICNKGSIGSSSSRGSSFGSSISSDSLCDVRSPTSPADDEDEEMAPSCTAEENRKNSAKLRSANNNNNNKFGKPLIVSMPSSAATAAEATTQETGRRRRRTSDMDSPRAKQERRTDSSRAMLHSGAVRVATASAAAATRSVNDHSSEDAAALRLTSVPMQICVAPSSSSAKRLRNETVVASSSLQEYKLSFSEQLRKCGKKTTPTRASSSSPSSDKPLTRAVRQWERENGKRWYELSAEEREVANRQITERSIALLHQQQLYAQ